MPSTIQIKRTGKDWSELTSKKLEYGEPLYVHQQKGLDEHGRPIYEDYLVIGSNSGTITTTIPNEKRIAFSIKELEDAGVYYDVNIGLVDKNGNPIDVSSELSNLVFDDGNGHTVVYNGQEAKTITAETVGAVKGGSNPQVDTPDIDETESDRIATVGYVRNYIAQPIMKGYKVYDYTGGTNILDNLDWNTEYRLGSRSGELRITLPAVTNENIQYSAELRLCLYCMDSISVTMTYPDNIVLLGMDDFSALVRGTYYEVSFANIGATKIGSSTKTYVSCLVNKTELQ